MQFAALKLKNNHDIFFVRVNRIILFQSDRGGGSRVWVDAIDDDGGTCVMLVQESPEEILGILEKL